MFDGCLKVCDELGLRCDLWDRMGFKTSDIDYLHYLDCRFFEFNIFIDGNLWEFVVHSNRQRDTDTCFQDVV